MMTLNKKILIAVCAGVLVIIIAFAIIYCCKKKGDANNNLDELTIAMFDQDNPATARDFLAKLKRDYESAKKENDYIDRISRLAEDAKANATRIDIPSAKTISDNYRSADVVNDFLTRLSVSVLFPDQDKSNAYTRNYDDAPSNTERLFQSVRTNYSSFLINILTARAGFNLYEISQYTQLYDIYAPKYGIRDSSKLRLDSALLSAIKTAAVDFINGFQQNLQKDKILVTEKIVKANNEFNVQLTKYKQTRMDVSGTAIYVGIGAFVITALTMYIVGLYYRDRIRERAADPNDPVTQEDVKLSMWYSVYIITVLLLIITIFILGLAKFLTENSLAALLGGIAGYVLNGKQPDANKPVPSPRPS